MSGGRRQPAGLSRQRGIGLAAAIFVITVMVVLVVAIDKLVATNVQSFEEEVRLTGALYAAESGAGFAMNRLFPPTGYPDYLTSTCPGLLEPTTYEAFTVAGLENCQATVSCSMTTLDGEGGATTDFYTITSTGTCGDVQRSIQVQTRFEP